MLRCVARQLLTVPPRLRYTRVMLTTTDGRAVRSAIEEAVYVVFGGPTKASLALQCSNSNVQALVSQGFVRRRDTALAIEELTAGRGCKVPAAELMALVPWQGPSRHPGLRTPAEAKTVAAISQARRNTAQTAGVTAQVRGTLRRMPKGGRGMPSRCTHAASRLTPLTPAAAAA